MTPIITLTSDWGTCDFFAGMVKGWLMSHIPEVRIVDITHTIPHYDLSRATFVVRQGCLGFPPGTIHLIDVDSSNGQQQDYLVVEYRQQYYLCRDNGLPSQVFGNEATAVYTIDAPSGFASTFVAYDLFCPVAEQLAKGAEPTTMGIPKAALAASTPIGYSNMGDQLRLYVLYIDSYGNAYLNISRTEFDAIAAGRRYTFLFRGYKATGIMHCYPSISSSQKNAILVTESATGLLQVALPRKSAEQLIGIQPSEIVVVKFDS